jgi:type I restriction enzyme M protein
VNLYLHGVGASGDVECPVRVGDSLNGDPGDRFDMVLTNPPFGKTWSNTVVNEEGRADRQTLKYERADYCPTTTNKQLNILLHVKTLLEINGSAAIVVPDNVLFFDRKPAAETPWTRQL